MRSPLLLLYFIAAFGLGAQTLRVNPAIEIAFEIGAGKGYQIESSTDLAKWVAYSSSGLGEGSTVQQLVPASEANRYFRVKSNDVRDLNALLEPIRATNKVPALACAVIRSNQIVGLGAVGLRKAGVTSAPVTLNDKWHHGSLTKGMTATLAAMLVEEGKISWTTTLAQLFPDIAPAMNAQWRGVTLEWLCSNRGGAPESLTAGGLWDQLWNFGGTPREGRRFLLEKLTALAPVSTPGTKYEYSNAGFSMAGHMLETVMDRPWEDLLAERLFRPLGMTSAGFGVPATPRHIDHPWGHQLSGGNPSPMAPGTAADNPPAIGPAGTVHCSVIDLARYVALHLAGHQADTALLKRDTFLKLHTAVPSNANYAYGWLAVDRPWAGGDKALTHSGSNLQWFSVIWMAPGRDFAVIAICNLATPSSPNPAATATDQVAGKMIQEFLN